MCFGCGEGRGLERERHYYDVSITRMSSLTTSSLSRNRVRSIRLRRTNEKKLAFLLHSALRHPMAYVYPLRSPPLAVSGVQSSHQTQCLFGTRNTDSTSSIAHPSFDESFAAEVQGQKVRE